MAAADSREMLRIVFRDEIASTLLNECGFQMPINIDKKMEIESALLDYHLMMKVKMAMDQFIEGLEVLDVLRSIRQHPSIFKDFFLYSEQPINAGKTYIFTVP